MKEKTRNELLKRINDCISAAKELDDFSSNALKTDGILSSDDCSCLTMVAITANALGATTIALVKHMMSSLELNHENQKREQLN